MFTGFKQSLTKLALILSKAYVIRNCFIAECHHKKLHFMLQRSAKIKKISNIRLKRGGSILPISYT